MCRIAFYSFARAKYTPCFYIICIWHRTKPNGEVL